MLTLEFTIFTNFVIPFLNCKFAISFSDKENLPYCLKPIVFELLYFSGEIV